MNIFLLNAIIITAIMLNSCFAQNQLLRDINSFRVVFYNVENLFDTINDPLTEDEEFLSSSKKEWTPNRYDVKLNNLAAVIKSTGSGRYPEIVGLCEIENRNTLNDLVKKTILKETEYNIIHEESPDERGIDVALLYRKDALNYILHEKISIHFPFNTKEKTRDILYVKGIVKNSDTLHLFVNHWSSRRGGTDETEVNRCFIAAELRKKIDQILTLNINSKILIMGDFNDNPNNKSINQVLGAVNVEQNTDKGALYNLMWNKYIKEQSGSYLYKGNWDMLDQIIISYGLFEKAGLYITEKNGNIYKPDWILKKDEKTGKSEPFKTYEWNTYRGGYSDHLPVFVDFVSHQ